MKVVERWRQRFFNIAWKYNFAGRLIEKTQCTLSEAIEQAEKAQNNIPRWYDRKGSEVADYWIRLTNVHAD